MSVNKTNPQWRAHTQLVRGGPHRTQFAETNEAIFMTSGYVYETAEQAQRAQAEEAKKKPLAQPSWLPKAPWD